MTRDTRTSTARRRPRRVATTFALLTAAGLLASNPAWAHAALISSTPAEGASIATLPTSVSFTFDENVAEPAFVAVTAPDGRSIIDGSPRILDATLTQAIKPVDEKGTYAMSYRVVSADGHPVTATLTFTVTTGRSVTQVPVGTTKGGHSSHGASGSFLSDHSIEVVIAILVLVIGLALLIGSGTRSVGGKRQ